MPEVSWALGKLQLVFYGDDYDYDDDNDYDDDDDVMSSFRGISFYPLPRLCRSVPLAPQLLG